MKTLIALTLLALSVSSAFADGLWAGNVRIHYTHRDINQTTEYQGQTIQDNIASYDTYTVRFEVYKPGVTDMPGVEVWKLIDAQASLLRDSNGQEAAHAYVKLVGKSGNNAVYQLELAQVSPQTVFDVDPELRYGKTMLTHLQIALDGDVRITIPIAFTYRP